MAFQFADDYSRFRVKVLHHRRYVRELAVESFLQTIVETAATRHTEIHAGSHFWRAQLGHTYRLQDEGQPHELEIECAFPPERMKPVPELVRDGRVNPRGIAYLYMATSENTACSEVRPWLHSSISLAQFRTTRNLKIVDCTKDKHRWFKALGVDGIVPWDPAEYEEVVWGDVGFAMSQPVQADDGSLNYVPTQIIAEALRAAGVEGIAYRSLLGPEGANVVLFDIADAELVNCRLMSVDAIKYQVSQIDNPYFIRRKTGDSGSEQPTS